CLIELVILVDQPVLFFQANERDLFLSTGRDNTSHAFPFDLCAPSNRIYCSGTFGLLERLRTCAWFGVLLKRKSSKAQNGARLPGFAIRILLLRVCFGFRVSTLRSTATEDGSDFGFRASSRSLCGTILKTRKLFLHERLALSEVASKW